MPLYHGGTGSVGPGTRLAACMGLVWRLQESFTILLRCGRQHRLASVQKSSWMRTVILPVFRSNAIIVVLRLILGSGDCQMTRRCVPAFAGLRVTVPKISMRAFSVVYTAVGKSMAKARLSA
ncbi:MAG: hypothetical protein LUB58_01800 [Oscillospiraceae bacterium]|nr:hypothetical protein [Oscillospiraceae bacterium]